MTKLSFTFRTSTKAFVLSVGLGLVGVSGCSDDDDDMTTKLDSGGASSPSDAGMTPDSGDVSSSGDAAAAPDVATAATTFKVRLENVAPFTLLKSGVFSTKVGGATPGPIAPTEAYEFKVTAGKGHKLAFATMFGQSNDWVFATAAGGIDLYEADVPISGDVTSKIALYDVGTEIDEEPAVGPHTGPNQATSPDGPGALDPNTKVRKLGAAVTLTAGGTFALPAVPTMIKVTITPAPAMREFTVRIENVANDTSTLSTSQGPKPVRLSPGVWALVASGDALFTEGAADRGQGLEEIAEGGNTAKLAASVVPLTGLPTGLSPGVFVVHGSGMPLFTLGQRDRGQGLERIAEEGNIMALSTALQTPPAGAKATGTFAIPVGKMAAGPIASGGAYEFTVTAARGDRLSLVTMYGWSNDWVFGTPDTGISLFDATTGAPVTGDVTAQMHLYDVGTEMSEEPAVGPNTGPQQPAPDTGAADGDANVREVPVATYATPVAKHLKLTLTPQ